jgi:cytochrome c biogenesis protein CcmG, thiol:disulfide interchange protein DsbE
VNRRLWLALPLFLFALFVLAVGWRLSEPPDPTVQSRLVGKPLPAFALSPMLPGRPGLSSADFGKGEPRLVNLFASWCVPCIAEAPSLLELRKRGIPIDAIALRDRPEDVARFLADHGDPFARIGTDPVGEAQIALGSSGVPESFIVDGRGIIRYQHIGPIMPQDLPRILAEWEKMK